jgi:hypothetical protein
MLLPRALWLTIDVPSMGSILILQDPPTAAALFCYVTANQNEVVLRNRVKSALEPIWRSYQTIVASVVPIRISEITSG